MHGRAGAQGRLRAHARRPAPGLHGARKHARRVHGAARGRRLGMRARQAGIERARGARSSTHAEMVRSHGIIRTLPRQRGARGRTGSSGAVTEPTVETGGSAAHIHILQGRERAKLGRDRAGELVVVQIPTAAKNEGNTRESLSGARTDVQQSAARPRADGGADVGAESQLPPPNTRLPWLRRRAARAPAMASSWASARRGSKSPRGVGGAGGAAGGRARPSYANGDGGGTYIPAWTNSGRSGIVAYGACCGTGGRPSRVGGRAACGCVAPK